MPRLYGRDKEAIDFRHVIDSLIRKPGAFANYRYQNHLYPTTRFRMAYDTLLKNTTEASAVKQYLKILHAAKHEGLDTVDDILRWIMSNGNTLTAKTVLSMIASQQQLPSPTDLNVDPPDLIDFDTLLQHKDVYDGQENGSDQNDLAAQLGFAEAEGLDCGLSSYDEHLRPATATERSASTDDPRVALSDGRAGGTGQLDALAVFVGADVKGMRIAQSESDRAIDEGLALTSGQDMGSVSMVAVATSCDAAVRDPAQRKLLGSTRQLVDFWETRFGKNEFTCGIGGSVGAAWPLCVLYDLPDVGARTTPFQTRSSDGTLHQEAEQVRGLDHRRSRLRATESRGDGSAVHATLGALRKRQRVAEQQPTVFKVGTNLQRPDDNCCGDRSLDSPLGDHRTEHRQLSPGGSQGKRNFQGVLGWLQAYGASLVNFTCRKEF